MLPLELRDYLKVVDAAEVDLPYAAYDWSWDAGPDGSPVSLTTLVRWRSLVRQRLIATAFFHLRPQLGPRWSDRLPEAVQLETALDQLSPKALQAFRARFGRACLDHAGNGTETLRRANSGTSRRAAHPYIHALKTVAAPFSVVIDSRRRKTSPKPLSPRDSVVGAHRGGEQRATRNIAIAERDAQLRLERAAVRPESNHRHGHTRCGFQGRICRPKNTCAAAISIAPAPSHGWIARIDDFVIQWDERALPESAITSALPRRKCSLSITARSRRSIQVETRPLPQTARTMPYKIGASRACRASNWRACRRSLRARSASDPT